MDSTPKHSGYKISITNSITDDGKKRTRDHDGITSVIIHRIDVGESGRDIARAFTSNPDIGKYTNGQIPYTLIVKRNGGIEQLLPISEVGPHAMRWNVPAIGIGVIGDFRKHRPEVEQWVGCVKLCTYISQWLTDPKRIFGHDELKNATNSKGKVCPGPYWDMDLFREAVLMNRKALAYSELIVAGVLF